MTFSRPFVFFLIFAAALGLYSSALTGQFIWDDEYQIRDNRYLTAWQYLPDIFTKNITAGADSDCHFYRPIQIFSYRLDYLLWKLEPFGYHLTGILLHALAAWFLFLLLESWSVARPIAVLSTLFFLIHPIQTEAVAYLSGRADLLALVFMLAALLADPKKKFLAAAFFTLALLSKESALIFPVLLAISTAARGERASLRGLTPFLLISVAYLLLRFTVLVPFAFPAEARTFLDRLPGIFASLVGYARVILFPWSGLHMEYGLYFFRWDHPQVLLGLGIFLGLALFFWRFRMNRNVRIGGAWLTAAWLPVSGIFPLNASMAEHWLYLPSIGIFLLAGSAFGLFIQNKKTKIAGTIICLALISLYAAKTYQQNFYWSDNAHFSKETLRFMPNSWRAHYMLGLHYGSIGEKAKAAGHYERAFEINPGFAEAYYNLGNLLASVNDDAGAEEYYLKAIKVNPRYAPAYNNLANIYSRLGEHGKALSYYQQAVQIDPASAIAQKNLRAERAVIK